MSLDRGRATAFSNETQPVSKGAQQASVTLHIFPELATVAAYVSFESLH
jgi:hypothetical protein